MIGAPLANKMMLFFHTSHSLGVWETFVALGTVYLVFMMAGAFGYRVPPSGWRPRGWTPPTSDLLMITSRHVNVKVVHKTLQFWLLWSVLCLNVSAGIGVLGMASPMLQEIFGGALVGAPHVGFTALTSAQRTSVADYRGRIRRTLVAIQYRRPLLLGVTIGQTRSQGDLYDILRSWYRALRVGTLASPCGAQGAFRCFLVRDRLDVWRRVCCDSCVSRRHLRHTICGTDHGRLLTAWSTAGIVGPVVVNYIREAQINAGVPRRTGL